MELAVLLGLQMLGTSIFSAFEAETPAWRKLAKWLTMTLVTLIPYRFVGHWALLFPATIGATGLVVHWWYCRRHQIHPLHATPRSRYYQLRGWPTP